LFHKFIFGLFYTSNAIAMILILLSWLYFTSPLIKPKQTQTIALVQNNQRSLLFEDADYDGHSLSILQKIAGALNQKVEIKFSAIAS